MNDDPVPSPRDYARLRRALIGVLAIVLANIIVLFAIQSKQADATIIDWLFCLLYTSVPIVCLVALLRTSFTPQDDLTHKRFVMASKIGRRTCLWSGFGFTALGLVAISFVDGQALPYIAWFTVSGLLLACWSFQFPKILSPAGEPHRLKPPQFFVRTWLFWTFMVAVYMACVVWQCDPHESMIMRLLQPLISFTVLLGAAWFVTTLIAFFAVPLYWMWSGVAKLWRQRIARGRSEVTP